MAKNYAHNIFCEFLKMRALWSEVVFFRVFRQAIWPFQILDIFRNVQNAFLNFKPKKVDFFNIRWSRSDCLRVH